MKNLVSTFILLLGTAACGSLTGALPQGSNNASSGGNVTSGAASCGNGNGVGASNGGATHNPLAPWTQVASSKAFSVEGISGNGIFWGLDSNYNNAFSTDGGKTWAVSPNSSIDIPANPQDCSIEVATRDGNLTYGVCRLPTVNFHIPSIGVTADFGTDWQTAVEGYALVAADEADPNIVYGTSASNDGLSVSHDRGHTWTSTLSGFVSTTALVPHVPGALFTWSETKGTAFSADYAATWKTLPYDQEVFKFTVFDANTIYIVNDNSFGLARSNDGGSTWNSVPRTTEVANVTVDPKDANSLYGTGVKLTSSDNPPLVWHSADGGQTWQDASSGLPPLLQCDGLVLMTDYATQTIVIGNGRGLWRQ